jgi:hypothetical protein
MLALCALLAALLPCFFAPRAAAQDDPNETPLGDIARSLRKKTADSQAVLDDDNFSKVMDEAESRRTSGLALKFLMAGEAKGFMVSAPDVTCSLAFNANAKSLLSSQYAQMELPPGEMVKLAGPATIEGDALTVSVFNGTDWHVSEVTVALTIVKRNEPGDALFSGDTAAATAAIPRIPTEQGGSEVRPEKRPDHTVIYHMRAASPPSSTTTFSAPLNLELAPGEEWHWATVQARGYPPQSYASGVQQATAQIGEPANGRLPLAPALLVPQTSSAAPAQNPR